MYSIATLGLKSSATSITFPWLFVNKALADRRVPKRHPFEQDMLGSFSKIALAALPPAVRLVNRRPFAAETDERLPPCSAYHKQPRNEVHRGEASRLYYSKFQSFSEYRVEAHQA